MNKEESEIIGSQSKQSETKQEYYNFLVNGNGIIACYCMFPTQFGKIKNMKAYLQKLKDMGFNAFWVNPIQTPGSVKDLSKRDKLLGVKPGNEVTQSLYAMHDEFMISPEFSDIPLTSADPGFEENKTGDRTHLSKEEIMERDTVSLNGLTSEAKRLGIVPMFDLVLNHVAKDHPFTTDPEKKHWFKEGEGPFKDAKEFNYKDSVIRSEIIEQFWEPYIRRYMLDYGFDGVRVDAVGYLEPELREEIYKFIYKLAEDNNKPRPVILDEALFGADIEIDGKRNNSLRDIVDKKLRLPGDYGPSHITTGVYYKEREPSGGMDSYTKEELGTKAEVVFLKKDKSPRKDAKGGNINFTGNHDHLPLAATVIHRLAKRRMEERNPELRNLLHHMERDSSLNEETRNEEARIDMSIYYYVQQIEEEIKNGNVETINLVDRKMRESIVMNAMQSGGGWFMLSGDEWGDMNPKPVFHRLNALDQAYYAEREHKIFSNENKEVAESVLREWARELIQQDRSTSLMAHVYQEMAYDPRQQDNLLAPFIENLKNQINAGDSKICSQFEKRLNRKGIDSSFRDEDYISVPRNAENGWKGNFDMTRFIRDMNLILRQLPTTSPAFWSEMFTIPGKEDLIFVVRKNGFELTSETDIVAVNINRNQKVTLDPKDLHDLAVEFQKRVIKPEDRYIGNEHFDNAYHSIMNCIPKRIFTNSGIDLHTSLEVSAKDQSKFSAIFKSEEEPNTSLSRDMRSMVEEDTIPLNKEKSEKTEKQEGVAPESHKIKQQ